METFSAVKAKSYSTFGRGLNDWEVFKYAAISSGKHWFKDLLSLWCPSGLASDKYGLRLAIRDNYLNFYRCGQSVARVTSVRGELVADVHYKYVLGDRRGYEGPLYLRMNAEGLFPKATDIRPYDGAATLREWILAADEYVGVEKSIVDKLVAENEQVIDLEMALPAWTASNVAVRMDLVAIQKDEVVFWEVKTVDDSRIRCKAELKADEFPHVLKQLANYREFLKQGSSSTSSAHTGKQPRISYP